MVQLRRPGIDDLKLPWVITREKLWFLSPETSLVSQSKIYGPEVLIICSFLTRIKHLKLTCYMIHKQV